MSTPAIMNSILTSKVYVGDADKIQSNRIQNPDAMMCPIWGGTDLAGRQVCSDAFYTKREGCNSSLDRIKVENFLRPGYTNYVTISAAGIGGENANYGPNTTVMSANFADAQRSQLSANSPRFGLVSTEAILPSSQKTDVMAANGYQSADATAMRAQDARVRQSLNIGSTSQQTYNKMNSGRTNPNTVYQVNQYGNYEPRGGRLANYALAGAM